MFRVLGIAFSISLIAGLAPAMAQVPAKAPPATAPRGAADLEPVSYWDQLR